MAKKNFKGGLDTLLSNSDFEDEINSNEQLSELSDEMKHWLLIKIERLNEELYLWRTGKINLEQFSKSLEDSGLYYDDNTNQIKKK